MNKISTRHIKLTIMLAMLMVASAAMAQRAGGPEPPSADPKVIVGGSVYGGGNLANVGGNTSVTINQVGSQVGVDVYGGGALADVGASTTNTTTVTLSNGKVLGDVYGGGLGDNTTPAMVNGNVEVVVNNGSVSVGGSVFGCNNVNGTPLGTVTVTINGSASSTITEGVKNYAIGGVYGGGNLAHYDPTTPDSYPTVTVNGCTTSIKDVYGGGNAASVPYTSVTINGGDIDRVFAGGNGESGTPAHVGWKNIVAAPSTDSYGAGTALATIHGGTINQVFSGSNANGVIRETMGVSVSKEGSCAIHVGELYGGGNMAPSQPGTITVGCMDENDMIDNLYGGANQANITGDILLNIETGRIGNVFGGNNTRGSISGSITVNIDKDDAASCANDWFVGNVYGGGNLAAYSAPSGNLSYPKVNILNGLVTYDVYGGGLGSSATVTGNPVVTINGGSVGRDVFGGGSEAAVSGATHVTVTTGSVGRDVYGGGALANTGATTVDIMGGIITRDIYGGGLGDGSHAPAINGTVTVNIGDVVTWDTEHPGFTAETTGNATIGGSVYGCNNAAGSPQDNVAVNIYKTAHTLTDTYDYNPSTNGNIPATFAIQNVFGGGNKADFRVSGKSATVNIYGCDNTIGRTFGGGNAAATNTVTTMIQGGRFNEAYAGGNGEVSAANIFGNANLYIHGGSVVFSFAGSNQNGLITGTSLVTMDNEGGCGNIMIEEHFCGNNFSNYYGNIEAVIECPGLHVKNLYGGCKQAHVLKYPTAAEIDASPSSFPGVIDLYNEHHSTWDEEYAGTGGNIHLTVKGGDYLNIYGGSQGTETTPANIDGNITLDVFGGTVRNAIYGGSHINGSVGGNIIVNVENKHNEGCELEADIADVYGGGNKADYNTTDHTEHDYPQVNIKNAAVKNVFGGGLEAQVTGNPQIKIKKGADVHENVYGGGNMGEVHGDTKVIINGKME